MTDHVTTTGPVTKRSTILQKAIEDKEFYHPTNTWDRESVLYQSSILNENAKTESMFYIKSRRRVQQKDLPPYKRPRWKACSISKAERDCLLAATKRPTTLQKTKTESLSHINLAFKMKRPRQRAYSISKTKGKCLLAATKRPTTLQKTETESLSLIKSREGLLVSCNRKTYHPTKD